MQRDGLGIALHHEISCLRDINGPFRAAVVGLCTALAELWIILLSLKIYNGSVHRHVLNYCMFIGFYLVDRIVPVM